MPSRPSLTTHLPSSAWMAPTMSPNVPPAAASRIVTDGCVYILGVDSRIVSGAIRAKYKDLAGNGDPGGSQARDVSFEGINYLEKIIQIPFQLPVLDRRQIRRYLSSLGVQWPYHGNDVKTILSNGLPPNPRLIKRVVNAYLLLWQLALARGLAADGEEDAAPGLDKPITPLRLAKIVALQTAYPTEFEGIRNKPSLLQSLESYCRMSGQEQDAWLKDHQVDTIVSELGNNPTVAGLFVALENTENGTFDTLTPEDLGRFFSLAGEVLPSQLHNGIVTVVHSSPRAANTRLL